MKCVDFSKTMYMTDVTRDLCMVLHIRSTGVSMEYRRGNMRVVMEGWMLVLCTIIVFWPDWSDVDSDGTALRGCGWPYSVRHKRTKLPAIIVGLSVSG